MASCTSDDLGEEQPVSNSKELNVLLNIAFQLNDVTARGFARDGNGVTRTDDDDVTTPGLPVPESELKSLSVFVVNVTAEGDVQPATAKAFRFTENLPGYSPDGIGRSTYTAEIKTAPGRKYIYLAANLSTSQEETFTEQYRTADEKAVLSVTENAASLYSEEEGFAMFCMEKLDVEITPKQIVYPDNTTTSSYDFKLERLVAKVLLTADTYSDTGVGSNYVKIENEPVGENGWIRLNDIRYNLNKINKKTYLFPVIDSGKNRRTDPNLEIGNTAYLPDFSQSSPVVYKTAEQYNENKMPKENSDPYKDNVYTDGIYCTENIVYDPSNQSDDVRKQYTTHLHISARYIPRHLYMADNGEVVRRSYESSSDAEDIIRVQSGTGSDNTTNTYVDPTAPEYYYTERAKELITAKRADNFTKYENCWHQYTTYIDGISENGKMEFSNDYSSIYRNRYYILRVTGFDITNGPLLQIKSTVLPWTKEEENTWHSDIVTAISSQFEGTDYTETKNPDGIPISFNMMNTTGAGTDLYNATFKLTITASPGVSWNTSLSNPADFGIYVNSEKGLVSGGTLPTAAEDNTVQDNGDGTVTKEYSIAVYAKRGYEGITRKTYLSITAGGIRKLINMADIPMPGDSEHVLIIQQ